MDIFGLDNSREYHVSWWPKINDQIHSLSFVWNTSRIFGAYTIPFNPPNEKPTTVEFCSSIALTILRVYMIYVVFTTESWDLLFMSSSEYVEKGLDILLKIPIGMVVIVPWVFLLRKPQISYIAYDFAVFDKLVKKYNFPHNYQYFHIFATIFATINVIIPLLILVAIRGFRFWLKHITVLGFVGVSWSAGLLFNTVSNIILYHILCRVQVVNDLLRKHLDCDGFKNNTPNTMEMIRTFMRMHDKLGDIANNCSRCFAVTTVLTMIHVLVSQILTTFALVRVIFYHYDAIEFRDCLFYIFGTTSYCWMPICTIWMGGDIKKRSALTWKLVHRGINTTDDVEIGDLLQQFSEQMNHRSPSIDFRFFDVDWPLLVKACSDAATYLVIMIQFDVKQ